MPCIRCANLAGLAVPIHGDGVEIHLRYPEQTFDRLAQLFCTSPPLPRCRPMTSHSRELCGAATRRVRITQYFHNSYGTFGKSAVGVVDGVLTFLPRLVFQSRFLGALVIEETVLTTVELLLDPGHGRAHRIPYLVHATAIARALLILRRQQHEQGCRINAAVVTLERNFTERGHFPPPGVVEDFSGLRIAECRFFPCLGGGQK